MEHVISMEEILGPFWDLSPLPQTPLPPQTPQPPAAPEEEQPPPVTGIDDISSVIDGVVAHGDGGEGGVVMMDQTTMEWTFERLLEEEGLLLTNTTPPVANSSFSALNVEPVVVEEAVVEAEVEHGTMAPGAVTAVTDPMEYNALLKRKLEEDLVAFKMWRASTSVVNPERSEDSNNQNGGSKNQEQNKVINGEDQINNDAQSAEVRVKLSTSSSSKDPSPSDEDMDGEVEILGFKIPNEERARKRESARRSRYRKAAHLKELEDQVDQLRAENSCLLRRLAAVSKKYNDATVDNRVLKADMETLRAKVKMGEDSLKRAMEMNSVPSVPISAPPSSSNVSLVPIQDDIISYFTTPAADALVDNSFLPMVAAPLQLQAEELSTITGTLNATEINQIAATLQLQEPALFFGSI